MKVTTRKIEPGKYRAYKDGARTDVVIEKNLQDIKKWGMPQLWWVLLQSNDDEIDPPLLFNAAGKDRAIETLERIWSQ